MAYTRGKGTVLQAKDATAGTLPNTYTSITQAKSVTPPPMEFGVVETTHLLSTARERIVTIIDPGKMSFMLEFDPANAVHIQLYSAFNAATSVDWKITLADPGVCDVTFSGFITKFGLEQIQVDSVVTIPVEVQVTGSVTYTP